MGNITVNSWTEWDPLERVILGEPKGRMIQAPEPAWGYEWPEHGFPQGVYGEFPEEMQDKAKELYDNFADILRQEGVTVDRPDPLDFSQTVSTPDWEQESMVGNTARDVLLTVGNEILEATMSKRSRWYEYLNYRPLLEKYFKEDPDFRWEAAPKPRLTDQSYKDDYQKKTAKMSEEEMMERTRNKDWILTEKEPLFDAADVARVGKDLFVQRSTTTNEAGFRWLKQHFSDHRVHDVFFADTEPRHIDATWIPLKPGMALISKDRPPLKDEFVELMEKNDWDLIESAEPHHTEETKPKLTKSTPYLSLNMLKIDRDTVCVMEQEEAQIKQLRDLGFDVIEVPFWDAGAFGGGLHCATADVHRKGDCEDYFPNQIEGY